MKTRCLAIAVVSMLAVLLIPRVLQAAERADLIYYGGDILTMNDAAPMAEAVAVKGGRILAVGARDEVLELQGSGTKLVDLGGKTLLPGFFDPHSHVYGIGLQALTANLLPAPDGEGNSIADLQRLLRDHAKQNAQTVQDMGGWIVGFGYDDATLKERRHPTREELDAVSKDQPVYVIHQSGHIGAGNSKALALSGITADTPDPNGGVIRRKPGGKEPTGVLEETPHLQIAFRLLDQGQAFNERMFLAGMEMMARFGYTTAQEARASLSQVKVISSVADQGKLSLDVLAYPDVLAFEEAIAAPWLSQTYKNRFRVGGAKLTIDGSPQGKTAWRDRPYYTPPEGQDAGYAGYPAASREQVMNAVDEAFANNWQILTHANGEAAADLLIAAVREATPGMARRIGARC
jgi:predicted amidohydrolase YtcJ